MMCGKCKGMTGLVLLILGVIFLLKDYAVLDFKASAWAIVLIVIGLIHLACKKCPECQKMCK